MKREYVHNIQIYTKRIYKNMHITTFIYLTNKLVSFSSAVASYTIQLLIRSLRMIQHLISYNTIWNMTHDDYRVENLGVT